MQAGDVLEVHEHVLWVVLLEQGSGVGGVPRDVHWAWLWFHSLPAEDLPRVGVRPFGLFGSLLRLSQFLADLLLQTLEASKCYRY